MFYIYTHYHHLFRYILQGNKEKAEKFVRKAQKLYPSKKVSINLLPTFFLIYHSPINFRNNRNWLEVKIYIYHVVLNKIILFMFFKGGKGYNLRGFDTPYPASNIFFKWKLINKEGGGGFWHICVNSEYRLYLWTEKIGYKG